APIRRRRLFQRTGEPHGTRAHALCHQSLHLLQLLRSRSPVLVPQNHSADAGRPNVSSEIDPDTLLLEPRKVLPQRAPIRRYAVMLVDLPVGPNDGVIERRHRIPLARYFGSNALKYLRRQPRLDQNAQFGLAQHVDEPRRYHAVVSIRVLRSRRRPGLAVAGTLAVPHPITTRVPGEPRPLI